MKNYNQKSEPLVILAGPPEHHDNTKETGEEKMPEGFVHPQVFPLGQAVYHLSYNIYILMSTITLDSTQDFREKKTILNVFPPCDI